jgi:hypothetical protein
MPMNPIAEVRRLCPHRRLAPWEARTVAERQAYRLNALLGVSEPPFPEQGIEYLPRLEVRYARVKRLAGALSWRGGKWRIVVNARDFWGRQRFSLAHELKHVIDHPIQAAVYRDGRFGTAHHQAEKAADYFAACLLMPKAWLKRCYYDEGFRDPRVLAKRFQVSTQAMRYRFDQLGLPQPAGAR